MSVPEHVIVVGGGLAGSRTVAALREHGYTGRLSLLCAEQRLPYDRPPLSKAVLLGTTDDPTLDVDYGALEVDVRLGVRAMSLARTPDGLAVESADGLLAADRVVVATGARPRVLPGVTDAPGVHVLRTLDDAWSLRSALQGGPDVVIVGAGWIGAEVATAAVAAGGSVTVVEAAAVPLAAAVDAEIGAATVEWYAEAGVTLLLESRVARVEGASVELDDGGLLRADVVVAATGVVPEVAWLAGSGIELAPGSGALAVDPSLHSSLPGVYAVGDCAAYWSERFGARLALEHWDDALRGPDVVAAAICGETARHDPVPYFWSEQFGRTLQVVGYPTGADRLVRRGDSRDRSWGAGWLREGRLVAYVGVEQPREVMQARRAIDAGARPDPALLADPAVPVKGSWSS